MQPVKFAQVGIGGFGRSHLGSLAKVEAEGLARLDAVVIRSPDKYAAQIAELSQRGVRVFGALEELFSAGGVDIIALPTGLQYHVPQTIQCMEAGYDVLSEKPVAAVIQEADRLIAARQRLGKMVIIGYQAIFSPAIQTIKARLVSGKLGKIKSICVKGGWPRNDTYYTRNAWVAKLKSGDDYILDSPINNAFAHDLNNPLYLCGPTHHESATPVSIQAELYRARVEIESLDTASLRILTADGIEIIIALSHFTRENFNPSMVIHAEKGAVRWIQDDGATTITYSDGTEESVRNGGNAHPLPFYNAVEAFRGQAEPLCTPENARAQTLCINGAHEGCPNIANIPEDLIEEIYKDPSDPKSRFLVVDGLDDLIHRSLEEGKLFSELGAKWAQATEPFDLTGYEYFPGGKRPVSV